MKYLNLPSFYEFKLGDQKIIVLLDGTVTVHTEQMMLFAEPGEINDLLSSAYATTDYEASINAFLIEVGGQRILIDTGAGDLMGPTAGHLLESLNAAGFSPGDIDVVLLTHIHGDHSGGLFTNDDLTFPNAILYVSQHDLDYWLSEEIMCSAKPERQQSFRNAVAKIKPWLSAGRVIPFDNDTELFSGLSTWAQPGHTPGHTYFIFVSGNEKIVFCGDLVHVAEIQLANPRVAITLDVDPQTAVLARLNVLKQAAEERFWLAADHIAFPGIGHVSKSEIGYRWISAKFGIMPIA